MAPELAAPKGQRPAAKGMLRWAPVAGFGFLMIALSRHAGGGISDPDTLWHILAGDHLRRTWDFSGPDPFSAFTTGPWVLNQWLPELAMSFANQLFGLPGVAWLAQLGRIWVCASIYLACRRQSQPLPAALVAGLAVLGTASNLSPRPQLVGFALLAIVVSAWMSTAADGRPRWWLIAVCWIWACCHGTWVVGVLLGLAVVVGMLLDKRITPAQSARFALIPLLSLVAAALTPVGPRLFWSFEAVREVSPYIEEWRRPNLLEPSSLALLALMAIVAVTWSVRRDLASWSSLAICASGAGWGLMYGRGVALGAIILAPVAAQAVDRALGRARPHVGREPTVVAGAVMASLVFSALAAAAGPAAPTGVPSRIAPTLGLLAPGSVVFNDDLLGGWLMWSFPGLRHTADTRVELYGRAGAVDYLKAMRGGPGAIEIVNKRHPDAVLVKRESGLAAELERRGVWKVAAGDHGYVLLLPTAR
jgi:hypothetical protein